MHHLHAISCTNDSTIRWIVVGGYATPAGWCPPVKERWGIKHRNQFDVTTINPSSPTLDLSLPGFNNIVSIDISYNYHITIYMIYYYSKDIS